MTVAEAERFIRKIEKCESMGAKLLTLKYFMQKATVAAAGTASGFAADCLAVAEDIMREICPIQSWTCEADRLMSHANRKDKIAAIVARHARGEALFSSSSATREHVRMDIPSFAAIMERAEHAETQLKAMERELAEAHKERDEFRKELARERARVCVGGDVFEANRNQYILYLQTELDYLLQAEAAEKLADKRLTLLHRYGRHDSTCPISPKCNCGLAEALAAAPVKKEENVR